MCPYNCRWQWSQKRLWLFSFMQHTRFIYHWSDSDEKGKKWWWLTKIILIGPNKGTTIRRSKGGNVLTNQPRSGIFIRLPVMYKFDCLVMKKGTSVVWARRCKLLSTSENRGKKPPQHREREREREKRTEQMLKSSSIKLCVCARLY